MIGIGRRADGGNGLRFGHPGRRRQHRGPAEAVADQDPRRLSARAEEIGSCDQVADVGRESGVGEVAVAAAKTGEVEA